MKTINLNKFSSKQRIILDDTEYTVTGFTVQNYIEDDLGLDSLNKIEDPKKQAQAMVDVISKISDIPKAVLLAQPVGIIHAIIQVAQGIDPTAEAEDVDSAQASEGEPKKKS